MEQEKMQTTAETQSAAEKEWQAFDQKLEALKTGLFDNIFKNKETTAEKLENYNEEMCDFSDKIKEKYPDHEEYLAYHSLIGSTITFAAAPKLDFPGEYNIENFLTQEAEKYSK